MGGVEPEPTPVVPDGETVTPTDNVATWVECAGITKPYTNLTQILEDVVTLSALVSDENAVDYMVRSTTWADDVCSNQNAMSYIGLNSYCANTLLDDETWCTDICESEYFESVLNVKVPTMTSNTAPYGEVIFDSEMGSRFARYVFDGNSSTRWSSNNGNGTLTHWVGYDFQKILKINKVKLFATYDGQNYPFIIKLQGFNGTDWEDIITLESISTAAGTIDKSYDVLGEYLRFRVQISGYQQYTTGGVNIYTLQFYGREDV